MPHRKDLIADFSAEQRAKLAALILRFLTDSMVAEHIAVAAGPDVLNPSHEQFFSNHRAYISKLEGFLFNNGGAEFVPLPKWDDKNPIPDEFWAVKPRDNGTPRPYLNKHYNQLPPPAHPLPDKVKLPELCNFDDAVHVTHEIGGFLGGWHGEVHARLGGVMLEVSSNGLDPTTDAAAALIFWPWHAFNDEIYHQWERCKLLGSKSLTVGRNRDGRLEVFAVGTGGELWHCWQNETYGGWSLWQSLGGVSSEIAVIINDGRLELFAIGGNNALYHIWQPSWERWDGLVGARARQIAVGHNQDGRLEVFGVGLDGGLYHTVGNPQGWQPWLRLGRQDVKQMAVGRNSDGRLELFAVGADNNVYQIWQRRPNGGEWSDWLRSRLSPGRPVHTIAVSNNQDGRLDLFAATDNAQIWHSWQLTPNGSWSGSAYVTRPPSSFAPPVRQLAAEQDAGGRLNLFALNDEGVLLYAQQRRADEVASWTDWREFGSGKRFDRISIGKHSQGRLELFGVVRDDVIWHTWQWTDDDWERWHLL